MKDYPMPLRTRLCAMLFTVVLATAMSAAELEPALARADIDPKGSAIWVDGALTSFGSADLRENPPDLLWTTDGPAGSLGYTYGDSKTPGPRHLRIGFVRAITIGTVIARADVLSVLKPDAAYPGDPSDEKQWIPAQRLTRDGIVTSAEDSDDAVWVLPPGTATRALRFTHVAKASDRKFGGWVGGALALSQRYANLSVAAVAGANINGDRAELVVNQHEDGWKPWSSETSKDASVISAQNPAWITLAWTSPRDIAGVVGLNVGASSVEVQVCTAPAARHPAQATESEWRTVVPATASEPYYPKPFGPTSLPFPKSETTRGVRFRMIAPLDPKKVHNHIKGGIQDGRRVWLDELFVFEALGKKPLVAEAPAIPANEHPPIAIPFKLDRGGLVTLVIEDADGNRVRNLVANTHFEAGNNTVWWDGLDDRGRDEDAAGHGQYRIPGALVTPGSYRVRGLVHDDIGLTWEFTYHNAGNPPWETADSSGDWLADHSPPNAACFVPAGMTKDGKECVMLGSHIAENGSGLVWVDLDGQRQAGVKWLGGVWTGAPQLACDRGANASPDFYGYSASTFQGELRLGGLKRSGGDTSVLKWKFPSKETGEIAGVAARDGLIAVSLSKLDGVLLVAAKGGTIIGQLPCAKPRGIAFADDGALVAVSAGSIVRIPLPADLIAGADEAKLTTIAAGTKKVVTSGLDEPEGICVDGGRIYVSVRGDSQQVLVFGVDGKLQRKIGKAGPVKPVGVYDPQHMNNPAGVSLDSRGRVWVAENCYQPKRISVWNADGSMAAAYYGPTAYGGGGTLDPADPKRLFMMGMELGLDWDKGTSVVRNVYWPYKQDHQIAGEWGPEDPIHLGGRTYLTTSYNINPTNVPSVVGVWSYTNGKATLIAGAGRAADWDRVMDVIGLRDHFAVRWSGRIVPKATGMVEFLTASSDGSRLWIDGKLVINGWKDAEKRESKGSIALTAGKPVDFRLEWYHEGGRDTRTKLLWTGPDGKRETIVAADLIPEGAKAPGGITATWFTGIDLEKQLFTQVETSLEVNIPGGLLPTPGAESEAVRARLPEDAVKDIRNLIFTWCDRDGDEKITADELTFRVGNFGGMTVQSDLSLATSSGLVSKPTFVGDGVPMWDLATAKEVVPGGRSPNTSGGGHTLVCQDGWTVLTVPPEPAPRQSSLSGVRDGALKWTYPSLWPGLHPGHNSPVSDRPGMVVATTRVVGPPFKPTKGDAGWCWAMNSDMGMIYIFTSDGLFVSTLFTDSRLASRWSMPVAKRGMHLEETSLGQENFFPSLGQSPDGSIHVLTDASIVTVSGLESIRRLPERPLSITAKQLAEAQAWTVDQERRRQEAQGVRTLQVAMGGKAPAVDGVLDDWSGAAWAIIERRKDSRGQEDLTTAAVTVAGDRLYAAWKTGDQNLLKNAGTTWENLFKTGGCLDLMIGADSAAASDRRQPVAGDRRLLVTLVDGKPMAVLYTPVVPGHKGARQAFISPVSTVEMDAVVRVEDQITVAGKDGNYEVSVPLALLGLKPKAGDAIAADVGLLRGNGFATMRRVYWSNKGTQITEDLPSEAKLEPALWGRWVFAAGR